MVDRRKTKIYQRDFERRRKQKDRKIKGRTLTMQKCKEDKQ